MNKIIVGMRRKSLRLHAYWALTKPDRKPACICNVWQVPVLKRSSKVPFGARLQMELPETCVVVCFHIYFKDAHFELS
jgi:hypothetical protein